MPITLYWNNIRMVVPTSELAEALKQLKVADVEVSAGPISSRADQMQSWNMLGVYPGPKPSRTVRELTRDFLQLISDHRASGGAALVDVMRVLGVTHAKGVGSKTAQINKVLDTLGFATVDVYTNDRDANGDRYWKPGERLDLALGVFAAPPRAGYRGSVDAAMDEPALEEESETGS